MKPGSGAAVARTVRDREVGGSTPLSPTNHRHFAKMLHKFSFQQGKVSYANKFLESKAYKYAKEKGEIGYSEFATDPCRSIFKRFAQMFSPRPTDNANVNVSKIANEFVALTEIPLPIAFDPKTLKAAGVLKYDDTLKGNLTTAHPHYDSQKKEGINYLTYFSAQSSYKVYRISYGSKTREVIGTIPAKEPGYMHSFGMTQNYVVLAEYPFVVNPKSHITFLLDFTDSSIKINCGVSVKLARNPAAKA